MNATQPIATVFQLIKNVLKASLPHFRRISDMSPNAWLGVAGHVIALAIGITSTVGIYNFGAAFSEDAIGAKFALLLGSLFFGMLFQVIIINGIKVVVRDFAIKRAAAIGCMFLVVTMWALTVTASYGSYWNWLARDDYQNRATQLGINRASSPLENASVRFASATTDFGSVTTHTAKMMDAEEQGESCGYESGNGQGDRWNLRRDQKSKSQTLSGQLNGLNTTLRTSLGNMEVRDNATIANAYRDARATLESQVVKEAMAWIRDQRAGFAGGFKGELGAFTCSDPEMLRLLNSAEQSLKQLPTIPATPPRLVEISATQGMLMSFARFYGFGDGGELSQTSDYMPFFIPAMIELVMTILIIIGEFGRKDQPRLWDDDAETLDPRFTQVAQRFSKSGGPESVHDFLENHIVELEGAPMSCIIVPTGDKKARSLAKDLLLLCSLLRGRRFRHIDTLRPFRTRMPFAELPQTVAGAWNWNGQFCDVHLIPPELIDKLRHRITRQAEAQLFGGV